MLMTHLFFFKKQKQQQKKQNRASMFFGASQNIRGERAKDLGWEPSPVVLEDWADEGITSALAKLQQQ